MIPLLNGCSVFQQIFARTREMLQIIQGTFEASQKVSVTHDSFIKWPLRAVSNLRTCVFQVIQVRDGRPSSSKLIFLPRADLVTMWLRTSILRHLESLFN